MRRMKTRGARWAMVLAGMVMAFGMTGCMTALAAGAGAGAGYAVGHKVANDKNNNAQD